ncbi:MAG: ABC transporter permease subunit [Firmicutes bacterium]|jgi:multiple sugar transport system permease protein|nr:ABC transporter permease subunit [Bacillota bacterium]
MTKQKVSLFPYLLCLPAFLILIGILYPFGVGVWYSLTNYVFYLPKIDFVGLSNYLKSFQSIDFWLSMKTTLLYVVMALAIQVPLGIGIALLLNQSHRMFRFILPLPLMIPLVTSALMWKLMMNPDIGVLNYLLGILKLGEMGWLAMPQTALMSIVFIDVWTFTPFVALIMLASLQNIPKTQVEAAKIDGASDWAVFFSITLPLISPALIIVFLFRAIDSLNQFPLIYATTQGGPGNTTMTLHVRGWYEVIVSSRIGMGMTNLIILWGLCFGLSTYILKLWSRKTEERK